jgi:hypothetical protein
MGLMRGERGVNSVCYRVDMASQSWDQ